MKSIDKAIEEARSGMMPFDSWEMLPKETAEAFAAFCVYRDLGFSRTIKKAIDKVANDDAYSNSYGTWRKWAVDFRWKERAVDFDRCNEQLKQTENRKTIEAQAEKQREVTGLMLDVVKNRVQTMKPEELPISGVTEWVQVVVKIEKDIANTVCGTNSPNGNNETAIQGEFNFVSDFKGL